MAVPTIPGIQAIDYRDGQKLQICIHPVLT